MLSVAADRLADREYMGLVEAAREGRTIGRLDKAWSEAVRRKWTVVDMKSDWKVIYPFELK